MPDQTIPPPPTPTPDPSDSFASAPHPRPRPSAPQPAPGPRRALSYALVGGALITTVVALASPGWVVRKEAAAPVTTLPLFTEAPPPAPVSVAARRPRVELVFALDTTGSMTGLIEGAKRKIWSLASRSSCATGRARR